MDETLIREGLAHAGRTDASHGAHLAAVEPATMASGQGCLRAN
jgi:hypothetical protein